MKMSTNKAIPRMQKLNEQGMNIMESQTPDRFDLAIDHYHEAARIAVATGGIPDYETEFGVNAVHAKLFRGDSTEKLLLELMTIFESNQLQQRGIKHPSHYGFARVLEEVGIVLKYHKRILNSPHDALASLYDCFKSYTEIPNLRSPFWYAASGVLASAGASYFSALDNLSNEIMNKKAVDSASHRVYSIESTVFWDESKFLGQNKPMHWADLRNSELFARVGLESRLRDGETSGYELMNAYQTLGVPQVDLGGRDPKKHAEAEENYNKAIALTKDEEGKIRFMLPFSVLQARMAWFIHNARPENEVEIERLMAIVLEHQKDKGTAWPVIVKMDLRRDMLALAERAERLGATYAAGIRAMYAGSI
ncbi:hypothetical protein J4458_01450 [Candidatus Woesearchaeota archaeon]|nr:hypothetical protein [Candidatus Woesearchaeota archaeon]